MHEPEPASRDHQRCRNRLHEKSLIDKRQMAIEQCGAATAPAPAPPSDAGLPTDAAPPVDPARPIVRIITLEHGEHNDSTLYRFEKGWEVEFSPGPSLLGRKVFLYTNYVVADDQEEGGEFVRSQYYGLQWRAAEDAGDGAGAAGDAGDGAPLGAGVLLGGAAVCCRLRLRRAGSFHYYFVYDNAESPLGPAGSGWFQVAPTLRVGRAGRELAAAGLACQTVLAKCLGPLERWRGALRVARESGYNMLHFSPPQALGASGSGYCIADQLRLNPAFGDHSFADLEALLAEIRTDWEMLSICDVVLNHTANETPWLADHPEASYNCENCPHLRPAALLDALLARLSADVARGRYAARGVPPAVTAHEHIEAVGALLRAQLLPEARLHELFACDAPALSRAFRALAARRVPGPAEAEAGAEAEAELRLLEDPQFRRLRASVDMELALRLYNRHWPGCVDEEARLAASAARFRRRLDQLNEDAAAALRDHLHAAVDNVLAGMRYFRLQADGPRVQEVSERHPLVPRYFTWACDVEAPPAELEAALWGAAGARCMAHNGWVAGADPLQDFAAPAARGRVYLRRELVAWGDSVKLRYGAGPADSPFLWAHMRDYVQLTAELFDGLRLDNCHSTPLHVAEYMVDAARGARPELFVLAELFTDCAHADLVFVNRLGLAALVREAQAAADARGLARLLHGLGGRPVGGWLPARRAAAAPAAAPAMLLDVTHDNPSPLARRPVPDALARAALCAAAGCASGSTRAHDELVPHQVHVVDEARLYPQWGEGAGAGGGAGAGDEPRTGARSGMLAARRALNELHAALAAGGFDEQFVDQLDARTLAVTRHQPRARSSVVLVAVTAPDAGAAAPHTPPPLRFDGELDEILLEATLTPREGEGEAAGQGAEAHARVLAGLRGFECGVRRAVPLHESRVFARAQRAGAATELHFRALPPGTVAAVRVVPAPAARAALAELHAPLDAHAAGVPDPLALAPALADLALPDFTELLFRCDDEERAAGGGGVYAVPGHGPLVYAGLQGAVSLLDALAAAPDAPGHALCDNLRAGDWLADYCCARLERAPRLRALAARYRAALRPLQQLPRYLVPAYFAAAVRLLHAGVTRAALARLGGAGRGGPLARALALCSVQLLGAAPHAPLPPPAPAGAPSLSAGLPHFAVGYMRCWGRDTFVSLRGLMLLTERYEDARHHILAFAACLRHGLIPNLLDGGPRCRFNCRDAVWWWLRAVQQYCAAAPAGAGAALLAARVPRLFPTDDAPGDRPVDQPLHDVMQDALDAHFQGRAFRERGAGRALDAHMTERGFDVRIGVDPETGFPVGGSDANCGTWMDKMGSSERAGTRGTPATPRDGSAVELVALAYGAAAWLAGLHRAGRYPHPGVSRRDAAGAVTAWTFAEWAERIRRNFERHFWVPPAPGAADARPDLVHRRGIYKDSHGAARPWADYQLRCNFPIAMAVAPELFEPAHAWLALDAVERLLLGPLGVKTLDPADWAYRGDYDNAHVGDDPAVAHGFNYHQGPEWLWPLGFYLLARLAFAHQCGRHARTVAAGLAALGPLLAELRASPWRGLPELTNAGGAPCRDSCPTQAWSAALALEALDALTAAQRARPLAAD